MSNQQQERQEAVQAADVALDHLRRASDLLGSAGTWGVFDIFAGGAISSFIKRRKMTDAEDELAAARDALIALVDELEDVEGVASIRVGSSRFASTADILLDNPFVDLYVQGQINEARAKVHRAIQQVEAVRAELLS